MVLRGSFDLSGNGMGIIKDFYALKYLDLSYCWSIEVLPIELCNLEKLEYLNPSYFGACILPKELKYLLD